MYTYDMLPPTPYKVTLYSECAPPMTLNGTYINIVSRKGSTNTWVYQGRNTR